MSDLLPLFPLPNVVLFPNVFLPLHIFEPRYREMVADALATDRLIGMVLLRPGWERDYDGRPPIYPIGCSGVITHADRLPDGRYNIVLRGVERFKVRKEEDGRNYRRAVVEPLPDDRLMLADRAELRTCRGKLEALTPTTDTAGAAAMSDEEIVNALAQYLDLEPLEKQALLERPSLLARANSLIELLEMKTMAARTPGVTNMAH
jgi:Lon protease-like protein